jgi:hypothetical protein
LVLTFHRTAEGYKMRCPSCGAVVRLRVGKKRPPADDKTAALPLPPGEFDVELVPPEELPAPAPPAGARRRRLWPAVVGAAAAGGAAAAAWWFWH